MDFISRKKLKVSQDFEFHLESLKQNHSKVWEQALYSHARTIDLEISERDSKAEMKALKEENSKLSKNIKALQAHVNKFKKESLVMKRKYNEIEKHRDEIQQGAVKALEETMMHQEMEPWTTSNDAILREWKQLRYNIHDLVVQYLTVTPLESEGGSDRQEMRIIGDIREDPELQIPLLDTQIIEFGVEIRQKFSLKFVAMHEQEAHSELMLNEVMKLRAAEVLVSRIGVNESGKSWHITQLEKLMEPFKKRNAKADFRNGLARLFDSAIKIMTMFVRSRDIYQFGSLANITSEREFLYDAETMTISTCLMKPDGRPMEEPQGYAVVAVQSPSRFVVSTSEGEHFGRKELLFRAEVTVKRVEKKENGNKEREAEIIDESEEERPRQTELPSEANDSVIS
ncbi:hypothetical protein ED733_006400 [Metarhizium rileyi]|uniref:Uncharacterized protein n=1 Tax=Metarhizium rileyi (strain RCEF 4871) TaxID=1649241 RepID=A0A5C6GHU7_METRR|nr:hypothetical protein ED733_006400 [Metarhizium rileyi]